MVGYCFGSTNGGRDRGGVAEEIVLGVWVGGWVGGGGGGGWNEVLGVGIGWVGGWVGLTGELVARMTMSMSSPVFPAEAKARSAAVAASPRI